MRRETSDIYEIIALLASETSENRKIKEILLKEGVIAFYEDISKTFFRSSSSEEILRTHAGDNVIVKALLDQIAMIDAGLNKNRILNTFSKLVEKSKVAEKKKLLVNSMVDTIVSELKKIKAEKEFNVMGMHASWTFESSNLWNLTAMIWSSLSKNLLADFLSFNDQLTIVELTRNVFFELVQSEDNIERDLLDTLQFWNEELLFEEIVKIKKGILLEVDSQVCKSMKDGIEYSVYIFEEV